MKRVGICELEEMGKNVSEVRMKRLFEIWSLIPKTLNPVGFVFVYMFSFLIIFVWFWVYLLVCT